MPEYPPLTPEEQATLDQLTYQQAMADWETAETARLAELALLAPLDDCGELEAMITALGSIADAALSDDLKERAGRVKKIVSLDLKVLFDRRAALEIPTPQPEAPPE
ncbi:hypothetical protein KNJ79_05440 [Sphingopyxis indica]|uniref:hypothetical protein n=1 Tax=Sphingopyxis indica TaxID=436663 RepID=UPI002939478B|nr:hypothetical protein [Sphingopyxis indica]WOF44377.1 hypothetical protein KNJ79_05440 [Sphingopyxis indica]